MMDFAIDVTPILKLGVDLAAAAQQIKTETEVAMTRSVILLERGAKQEVPRYTGTLFRAITHKVTPVAGGVQGEVGVSSGPATGYAEDVEKGSPPKQVPFNDLAKWAARQIGGNPKDPAFRSMVAEIQKRIATRGTQPHPYMAPSLANNRAAIDKEFAMVIPRAMKKLGSG